jgi:hypothetical protein
LDKIAMLAMFKTHALRIPSIYLKVAKMSKRAMLMLKVATFPTGAGRRELRSSEGKVSSLLEQRPVGELVAEGETPVLRETEDIQLLVVHEVRATVLVEVHLNPVQVLETRVHRGLGVVGGFAVASVHDTWRGNRFSFPTIPVQVLCVREG